LATYSIKDLATLSGIKAHTIRIWEQRYHLIEPKRTATNIRFYTDDDLKYVLNIAFLNKNGLRISQIAKMTREEIAQKVGNISQDNFEDTNQMQSLTMAMMQLNTAQFEGLIQANIAQNGFENCLLRLVVPFLEKISLLWLTNAIGNIHEQFVHNIIRRKILSAIDKLQITDANAPTCMVFLMEGETMEIVALLIKYLLKRRGILPIYLGVGIGINDLNTAATIHRPKFLFTSISEHHAKFSLSDYIQQLRNIFADTQILLTGYQVLNLSMSQAAAENIVVFEDFHDIADYLDQVVAAKTA